MKNEDASTASRKRKQASPQKLIRRLGVAKKRLKNVKTNRHQNLLQEEALELGFLNSTATHFFDDNDDLSVTPTSLVSRPSTHDDGHDVTSRFSGDVASVLLLSHGILLLPDLQNTTPAGVTRQGPPSVMSGFSIFVQSAAPASRVRLLCEQ